MDKEVQLDRVTAYFEVTKSGKVAVWESGGATTSQGDATVVANPDGSKKKALWIRRHGWLSNGQHALLPLRAGDWIIRAKKGDPDLQVQVWEITKVAVGKDQDGDLVPVVHGVLRYKKCYDQWNREYPLFLNIAVEAAEKKARIYHCRIPVFIIKEKQ